MNRDVLRKRELRQERKGKGLCIDCGKPAFPGVVRCVGCLYKRKQSQVAYKRRNREVEAQKDRERRAKWIQEGRCGRCGAPLIENETNYCSACLAGRHQPVIKGVV
jgi:hypothetical protein